MNKQITIRMPKADLKLWLAALRLPENQNRQGKGHLFSYGDEAGYCCLGVAQCIKTGGKVERRCLPSHAWLDSVGWEFYSGAGIPNNDPYLPKFGTNASFANDALGITFAEIADAVEDCAEGY